MKISVRGGGIYGCVIAHYLQDRGYDVTVYENASDILMGASFRNFRRLHAGFHYPKNIRLARECSRAHNRFVMRYGKFCKTMPTAYWIAHESEVSWEKYKAFLDELGRKYSKIWPDGVRNVFSGIGCEETVYDVAALRDYFKATLQIAHSEMPVDTFVVDCTYVQSPIAKNMDFKDSTILHLDVDLPKIAQTVLYGPFCGYIPAHEGGFLYYHVTLNDPPEMLKAGAEFFPKLRSAKILAVRNCRHVRKEGDDRSYTLASDDNGIYVVGGKVAQAVECAREVGKELENLDIMPDAGKAGKRLKASEKYQGYVHR